MIIISVYMCMCVQAHTFHPAFRQGLSCFFCRTILQTSWPASFWLALLSLPPILQIHTSASSIWCGCCGLNSVIKCFYFLSHLLGTTPSLVIESQMTHFHLCVRARMGVGVAGSHLQLRLALNFPSSWLSWVFKLVMCHHTQPVIYFSLGVAFMRHCTFFSFFLQECGYNYH